MAFCWLGHELADSCEFPGSTMSRKFERDGPDRSLDVDSLAQRAQAGFVNSLAERWMSVDGTAEVLQPGAHLKRQSEGARQFGYADADRGDAENQVIVGTRCNAHEAILTAQCQSAAVGCQWKHLDVHVVGGSARSLGRKAGGDNLRIGEADGRDRYGIE